jgi:hypothetical protein
VGTSDGTQFRLLFSSSSSDTSCPSP